MLLLLFAVAVVVFVAASFATPSLNLHFHLKSRGKNAGQSVLSVSQGGKGEAVDQLTTYGTSVSQ